MALNSGVLERKKCTNTHSKFYAFVALKLMMMKFQCTYFLFKMNDTSTFIFILRGLLNRYAFQTFSKLFIYISNIGKIFFCKKNVWNKARIKIQKLFIKILPYLLYQTRVYTRRRTPDGENFQDLHTSFIKSVYTRVGALQMERSDDKFDKVLQACIHA